MATPGSSPVARCKWWITMPGRNGSNGSSRQPPAISPRWDKLGMAEPRDDLIGGRRPSYDGTLGADHGKRGRLELGEVAFGRVLGEKAHIAAVVGLAHRGLYTYFGGDAREDQMSDSAVFEDAA